ncbi:MAG: polyphosphate kinase 2 family protein [Geodermatophilaceae bacterium]|nr:polyphosphate kinase 2 family protein [Geodermatophilaceae bacterium]
MAVNLRSVLALTPGPVALGDHDPRDTPQAPGKKESTAQATVGMGAELDGLQERLHVEGVHGGTRRILLVLQGMDTAGKGGVVSHVVGLVNPQGCRIASFKKPTTAELTHGFLWRIRRQLPPPGYLGVFDRSHYEDVLVARVHRLAEVRTVELRYGAINRFEARLAEAGTTVVKCFLHISPERQAERLLARLEDPTKHWKFNPGDIDERAHWKDYRRAYEIALERCRSDEAPWYLVPSDRKWYRNWAVAQLLLETLRDLDPHYPPADYDVAAQRARLTDP